MSLWEILVAIIIQPALDSSEPLSGGPRATAAGLSSPRLPPVPTPGIPVISPSNPACHAPLLGLPSHPSSLHFSGASSPFLLPPQPLPAKEADPYFKTCCGAPDAGQEIFHHLMTPLLCWDEASLALAWLLWALPAPGGTLHAFLASQLSWAVKMPENDWPEN